MGEHGIPFAMIYTKIDKVQRRDHKDHAGRIETALLKDWEELPPRFMLSSVTREGREELLQYLAALNIRVRGA